MDTRSCDRGVQQLVACIFVSEFVNSSLRGIPNVYCIYVLLRFFSLFLLNVLRNVYRSYCLLVFLLVCLCMCLYLRLFASITENVLTFTIG